MLNFHNIVERGWLGLTGRSNIRGRRVTLLGALVFPVVVAAVPSRWRCGEWGRHQDAGARGHTVSDSHALKETSAIY